MATPFETTEAAAADGGEPKYENFLDDPFNMAMYVVLPCMIVVYGGCCVIYCCAKLHRYCRRRQRRAQRRLLKNEPDSDDDSTGQVNPALTDNFGQKKTAAAAGQMTRKTSIAVVDLTEPAPAVPPPPGTLRMSGRGGAAAKKPRTLAERTGARPVPRAAAAAKQPQAPPIMPAKDPRRPSHTQGVLPGYKGTGQYDAENQMRYLDDQLKVAFKLINTNDVNKSSPAGAPKSRPDVCAKSNENAQPIKPKRHDSRMKFFLSDQ